MRASVFARLFTEVLAVLVIGFVATMPAPAQELGQAFSCLPGIIIKLPTDWKRIEKQVLDESAKEVIGALGNVGLKREEVVAGFRPESDQPHVGFPSIIVVTNNTGKVSDQELKELVPSLRQMQKSADATFSGNALKASVKVANVSYDDRHHFLRVEAVVPVSDWGTLRVVSIMFATQSGMVTFQFRSKEDQYQQSSPLFSKVIEGIEVFRPEYPLPPRDLQARETNKVYWTPKYGRMRWTEHGWVPPGG